MPTNYAAYLTGPKVSPLQVKSAPYTSPKEHQITIKNGAVAINFIDRLKQDLGNMMMSWIKYPFVLGSDVAGEVVEVGKGVTTFNVGDRVVGHAMAMSEKQNNNAEGAFQNYSVLLDHMAAKIPDTISYERACVLPMAVSTAACGLFQEDQLALQLPSVPPPKPTGKYVLITGGASSVGSNAIQLAVAAGYEVITTCSAKNFEYVKGLGAKKAFDYHSKTVTADLIDALKDKEVAGAVSLGQGSIYICMDVLDKCHGNKFISMLTYPMPDPEPTFLKIPRTILFLISFEITHLIKSKLRGINSKKGLVSTIAYNGVGRSVYVDFLSQALAEGTFVPSPEPLIVGKGLEFIQPAFEILKKGLSAQKPVVTLWRTRRRMIEGVKRRKHRDGILDLRRILINQDDHLCWEGSLCFCIDRQWSNEQAFDLSEFWCTCLVSLQHRDFSNEETYQLKKFLVWYVICMYKATWCNVDFLHTYLSTYLPTSSSNTSPCLQGSHPPPSCKKVLFFSRRSSGWNGNDPGQPKGDGISRWNCFLLLLSVL